MSYCLGVKNSWFGFYEYQLLVMQLYLESEVPFRKKIRNVKQRKSIYEVRKNSSTAWLKFESFFLILSLLVWLKISCWGKFVKCKLSHAMFGWALYDTSCWSTENKARKKQANKTPPSQLKKKHWQKTQKILKEDGSKFSLTTLSSELDWSSFPEDPDPQFMVAILLVFI